MSKLLISLRQSRSFFSLFLLFVLVNSVPAWIDGTHLLPQTVPIAPIASAPNQLKLPRIGNQRVFYAIDFRTQNQYYLKATLRAIGDFCYIYVQDSEWQRTVKFGALTSLIRSFEQSTPADASRGIYQIQTNLFGEPPDIDGDERIYILLLDKYFSIGLNNFRFTPQGII